MSDVDDLTRERTGVSRRTLVRAGAHAAWVVPAVTVISAAPAMAAVSAPVGSITFSGTGTGGAGTAAFTPSGSKTPKLSGTQVTATSATSVQTTITLVVTFPILITENNGGNGQTPPTGGAASGWSAPAFSGAGTSASPYTATYTQVVTGTPSGANVAFSPAAYTVKSNASGTSFTVSVSASAGYSTPAAVTVPIAA